MLGRLERNRDTTTKSANVPKPSARSSSENRQRHRISLRNVPIGCCFLRLSILYVKQITGAAIMSTIMVSPVEYEFSCILSMMDRNNAKATAQTSIAPPNKSKPASAFRIY